MGLGGQCMKCIQVLTLFQIKNLHVTYLRYTTELGRIFTVIIIQFMCQRIKITGQQPTIANLSVSIQVFVLALYWQRDPCTCSSLSGTSTC